MVARHKDATSKPTNGGGSQKSPGSAKNTYVSLCSS